MKRAAPFLAPTLGAIAAVLLTLTPGCKSSSETPSPAASPAQGAGGAVAVVTTGGRTKAYVYYGLSVLQNAQIAVVDVGVAGNGVAGAPARIGLIDVGPGDFGMSVAGNDRHVVAASIVDPRVHFVDPTTDRLEGSLALDASYQKFVVSDREAYVISIAIDSASNRAFLGVWDGVAVVDLATRAVTSRIRTAPTENLAYDHTRGWLLAPFYDCANSSLANPPPPTCGDYRSPAGAPMVSGLNLVDVRSGAVYTYQNPSAADPAAPLGVHPDGAALDPVTGLAVVTPEDTPLLFGLDLSRAVLDPAAKSFSAPAYQVTNPPLPTGPPTFTTAVMISDGGSYVLSLRETSSEVGFLARAALTSGTGPMVIGTMPDLPGGRTWQNRGDPHGITYARVAGRDTAILVNLDQDWMARVDLAILASLAHADPSAWTAAEMAPAVTYLDLTRAP